MKKLIFTLTAIIVFTIGRGQSFEGVIKYDVGTKFYGDLTYGIDHVATLTTKNGNIHTVLKSKREGQIEYVYLSDRDTSFQIDHIRQRYVIMPKQPVAAEIKVKATSDKKKILGQKTIKYESEGYAFWVAEEIQEVDCKLLLQNLPFVPCTQFKGFPLKIDVVMPNGSYTATVIEIRPMKVPNWYFDLNKEYEIVEAPLIRKDH